MSEFKNFICFGEWAEAIAKVEDKEQRYQMLYTLVMSGATQELCLPEEGKDNGFLQVWGQTVTNAALRNQDKFDRKVELGRAVGRHREYNELELQKLIAEGNTAVECAKALGISKETVYKSDIWKNRKKFDNYKIDQ